MFISTSSIIPPARKYSSFIANSLAMFFIILFTVSLIDVLTATSASAATTYSSESSPVEKAKTIKYYSNLEKCYTAFKTEIKGDDITKGPRWWINSNTTVFIGKQFDKWGDKNGLTSCSGESDSSPGWINEAFKMFGFNPDRGQNTLSSLGYDCDIEDRQTVCRNSNANKDASVSGSILNKLKNGSYLKGTNPVDTSSDDFKAMTYYTALQDIKGVCKGSRGGNSKLASVAVMSESTGKITTESWSLANDNLWYGESAVNLSEWNQNYSLRSCYGIATLTTENAEFYASWIAKTVCESEGVKGNQALEGCSRGIFNKNNYEACVSFQNISQRNPCFTSQGLSVSEDGKTSGELCFVMYGSESPLTKKEALVSACILGAENKDNDGICERTWDGNEAYYTNRVSACIDGKGLSVIAGTGTQINIPSIDETGTDGETLTSCAIDGIGWIVCPVLGFLGTITDVAFDFLAASFLATDIELVGTDTATYNAWTIMRNIANVAFVIAFLIIIFSQLSSVGINNYGIKKMLPRLIIAAVLVNISFFICQLAVDLSNILGYSIKNTFDGLSTYMQTPDQMASGDATGNGFGIAAIITTLVAGGITLAFTISIPVLLAVILALLMVVLILVARTALIILLVVVSPLAFVAYLLPNTEAWFKKWGKMFAGLLLVFPLISIVFGAGVLAAGVIKASAPDDNMVQLIAIGVAAVPLLVVPSLLRNSMNAVGSIGTKLSSMSSKANSSIGAKSRETSMLSAINRSRQQGSALRRARVQGKLARVIPGRAGRRLEATGAAAAQKIRSEEISDAEQQITSLGLTQDQRHELAMGNSVRTSSGATISGKGAVREAAVKIQGQTGNHDQIMSMVNAKMGGDLSRTLASSLATRSDKPAWLGAGALERVSTGDQSVTAEGLMAEAINNNAYSAEKIAIGDKDELLAISNIAATSSAVSPTGRIQIRDNAITALTDPVLSTKISKNKPGVDAISRI